MKGLDDAKNSGFSKPEGREDSLAVAHSLAVGHVCSPSPRVQPSVSLNPERIRRETFKHLYEVHTKLKRGILTTSLCAIFRRVRKRFAKGSSACWPVCEDSTVFAHLLSLAIVQPSPQQQPYGRRVYPCRFHFW